MKQSLEFDQHRHPINQNTTVIKLITLNLYTSLRSLIIQEL